ncbi:hypothetical protein M8818_002628 [Zalaria obscura]|uniref:Uncharacterized protein n=1 Tax=Zalaria obscura TaxID=2024903 RepID=A0ACC3SID3_9PEZI
MGGRQVAVGPRGGRLVGRSVRNPQRLASLFNVARLWVGSWKVQWRSDIERRMAGSKSREDERMLAGTQ